MYFTQIYTPGLAHCSYVLGGENKCLIVDPPRDIDRCLAAAKSFGLPVAGVIETHLHADFVSGHMEVAKATGATIFAPAAANCAFPHQALQDGESFSFDTLRITLLETPGHTPESAVFLVTDLERGEEPVLLFSGDTILVGDVGRPDLFPAIKEELASKLFYSLQRVAKLGEHIELYPAHGMGSLCGRSLSAKLWSTLGTERRYNYALQIGDEDQFCAALLNGMPEAPDHFARCSEINRRGPALLESLEQPVPLSAGRFSRLLRAGHQVVDTRDYLSFAAAHIPNSFSVGLQGNFSTFVGWVLPADMPLLLVLNNEADLQNALTGLRRVGLDRVTGYLEGGMQAWINGGMDTSQIEVISIFELSKRMAANNDLLVLDNRLRSEWDSGYIAGTVHLPAPHVRQRAGEWPPEQTVATLCNTSNRSILAASLLKRQGFTRVINVVGGTTAWTAAGFPLNGGA